MVFKIKDRDIPIVHRCLKVHESHDGKVQLLTKVGAVCCVLCVGRTIAAGVQVCCHRSKLTKPPNRVASLFAFSLSVLVQGDNNRVDDRGLYAPGQQWLNREDILGRATGASMCFGQWVSVSQTGLSAWTNLIFTLYIHVHFLPLHLQARYATWVW